MTNSVAKSRVNIAMDSVGNHLLENVHHYVSMIRSPNHIHIECTGAFDTRRAGCKAWIVNLDDINEKSSNDK